MIPLISKLREFWDQISDSFFFLRYGVSPRFVLANLVMNDRLREVVAFARIDVETALKFFDLDPELSKKKLKQAFDGLGELFE